MVETTFQLPQYRQRLMMVGMLLFITAWFLLGAIVTNWHWSTVLLVVLSSLLLLGVACLHHEVLVDDISIRLQVVLPFGRRWRRGFTAPFKHLTDLYEYRQYGARMIAIVAPEARPRQVILEFPSGEQGDRIIQHIVERSRLHSIDIEPGEALFVETDSIGMRRGPARDLYHLVARWSRFPSDRDRPATTATYAGVTKQTVDHLPAEGAVEWLRARGRQRWRVAGLITLVVLIAVGFVGYRPWRDTHQRTHPTDEQLQSYQELEEQFGYRLPADLDLVAFLRDSTNTSQAPYGATLRAVGWNSGRYAFVRSNDSSDQVWVDAPNDPAHQPAVNALEQLLSQWLVLARPSDLHGFTTVDRHGVSVPLFWARWSETYKSYYRGRTVTRVIDTVGAVAPLRVGNEVFLGYVMLSDDHYEDIQSYHPFTDSTNEGQRAAQLLFSGFETSAER